MTRHMNAEEIKKLAVCRTSESISFIPLRRDDGEMHEIVGLITMFMLENYDEDFLNVLFDNNTQTIHINWWTECMMYSFVFNYGEGYGVLHADCASTQTAELIRNICVMVHADKILFS